MSKPVVAIPADIREIEGNVWQATPNQYVRAAVKGRHSAALLELVQSAADGPDGVTAKYLSWVDESFPRRRPRGRHG